MQISLKACRFILFLCTYNLAKPYIAYKYQPISLFKLQIPSTMAFKIDWAKVKASIHDNLPEEGVVPTSGWAHTLQDIHWQGGLSYPCHLQAPVISPTEELNLIKQHITLNTHTFRTTHLKMVWCLSQLGPTPFKRSTGREVYPTPALTGTGCQPH